MLELLLTRPHEQPLVRGARGLTFLVLDELHTLIRLTRRERHGE